MNCFSSESEEKPLPEPPLAVVTLPAFSASARFEEELQNSVNDHLAVTPCKNQVNNDTDPVSCTNEGVSLLPTAAFASVEETIMSISSEEKHNYSSESEEAYSSGTEDAEEAGATAHREFRLFGVSE